MGKGTWLRLVEALVLACAACSDAASVRIATPRPRAIPVAVSEPPARGAWARAIPEGDGFAKYDVLNAGTVELTWRIGPAPMAPCDYDAMASQTLDLDVSSDRASVAIPLGRRYGVPQAMDLTSCGYRAHPDVVSTFNVSTGDRAVAFVVVRDGAMLRVAVQNVPTMVLCSETHYGPLESCRRHEWTRIAYDTIAFPVLADVAEAFAKHAFGN